MAGWMINCKEYAHLSSRGMDKSLSFWERLSMRIHLLLCKPCNLLREQFKIMREACRLVSADETPTPQSDVQLPDDVCRRIKSAIQKASEEKGL